MNKSNFLCVHIIVFSLLTIQLISGCNCKKEEDEISKATSVLQEFSIIDYKVDSVTRMMIHDFCLGKKHSKKIMVMELNEIDDTLEMVYSFHENKEKENIKINLISLANRRVLGYVHYSDIDILLLSNIDYIYDVVEKLSPLIKPLKGKYKENKFIFYDSKQYCSFWDGGYIYEPLRIHFKYKNGIVSKPSGRLGGLRR